MAPEQYLLLGLLGACAGLVLFLSVGHGLGEIDLFDIVRDDKKLSSRKVARIVALIASTMGYMFCMATKTEVVWSSGVYLGVWVANDLLQILAQAKGFAISTKAAKDGN